MSPVQFLPWVPGLAARGRQLLLNRVLFATDLSKESRAAIPYVLAAARTWNAEIDVLHVCSSGTLIAAT